MTPPPPGRTGFALRGARRGTPAMLLRTLERMVGATTVPINSVIEELLHVFILFMRGINAVHESLLGFICSGSFREGLRALSKKYDFFLAHPSK